MVFFIAILLVTVTNYNRGNRKLKEKEKFYCNSSDYRLTHTTYIQCIVLLFIFKIERDLIFLLQVFIVYS